MDCYQSGYVTRFKRRLRQYTSRFKYMYKRRGTRENNRLVLRTGFFEGWRMHAMRVVFGESMDVAMLPLSLSTNQILIPHILRVWW